MAVPITGPPGIKRSGGAQFAQTPGSPPAALIPASAGLIFNLVTDFPTAVPLVWAGAVRAARAGVVVRMACAGVVAADAALPSPTMATSVAATTTARW